MIEKIRMAVDDNRDYLVALVRDMVRFGSYSGQSEEIQVFLEQKMCELDMETRLIKVKPEKLEKYKGFSYDGFPYERRFSLLGVRRGSGVLKDSLKQRASSIILNGHVDIVPPGDLSRWDDDPLSGRYEGGRIFGRGSLDMKGGLAAGITAVKVLRDLGIRTIGDITIASVCGEETGGCGAFALVEDGISADGCIILEPTKQKICHIQSGCHTFKITLKGRSIHACMAYKGINVIDKFYLIYEALKAMDIGRHERFADLCAEKVQFYENRANVAPLNVGTLKAGEWPSSVPDYLEAHGRMGILPGETVEEMHKEFEETVKAAAASDSWLADNLPEIEWYEGLFEPSAIDSESELIQCLAECHRKAIGSMAEFEAVTYGSDMRIFNIYAGIPTVLYGPGDVSLAHTVNECADIDEITESVCAVALMLIKWCGISD
ncbi:MAG: ArgE/DapE family deacylase [Bacillota bacterium]|nr:ArgE/DapE family deacylase [Bacillota bacterium]MDW7729900.1 ArgE/DapE family deacylase [Bacillota bacterium]